MTDLIKTNPLTEDDYDESKAFPNMDCWRWDPDQRKMVENNPEVEIPDEFYASTGDAPEDLDLRYADVSTFLNESKYTMAKFEGAGYAMWEYLARDDLNPEFFLAVMRAMHEEKMLWDVAESPLSLHNIIRKLSILAPELIPGPNDVGFWLQDSAEEGPTYWEKYIKPYIVAA